MGDATRRLLAAAPGDVPLQAGADARRAATPPPEYGLIAEEVAEVFPDLVVYDAARASPSRSVPRDGADAAQRDAEAAARSRRQVIAELSSRLALLEGKAGSAAASKGGHPMKRAGLAIAVSAIVLGLAAPASAGNLTVGAGSTLDLGTGSLALGCADLDVAGTLTAGSVGLTGARDVAIAPGRHPERELRDALALRRLGQRGHLQRRHQHGPDGGRLRARSAAW